MRLRVRVIPNAARSEVVGWVGDALKVKLQAVPEDGKANRALCELLSGIVDCRVRQITIVSGEKSRIKVLELPVDGDPRTIFK